MIEMVIALAIVGAVAGVIAGLFGVGGGMILVPAFYYAFTTLGLHSFPTRRSSDLDRKSVV